MKQTTNTNYSSAGRVTYTTTRTDNLGNTVSASVVKPSKSDIRIARRERLSSGLSILNIVIMLLLVFAIYRVLVSSTPITFSSFLDILKNAPQFDVSKLSSVVPKLDEANVVFGALFRFFNYFIDVLNLVIFFGAGCVQVLAFAFYFLRFLFV